MPTFTFEPKYAINDTAYAVFLSTDFGGTYKYPSITKVIIKDIEFSSKSNEIYYTVFSEKESQWGYSKPELFEFKEENLYPDIESARDRFRGIAVRKAQELIDSVQNIPVEQLEEVRIK